MTQSEPHAASARPSPGPAPFLVVLDPGASHFRYLQIARELGYRAIVLSANPVACRAEEQAYKRRVPGYDESCVSVFMPYEPVGADALAKLLAPYRDRIAGVIAGDEFTVPLAAGLGRELGFDYAGAEDAEAQHDKAAMKRRLVVRGVPTPRFSVAESLEEALSLWTSFGCDCMVKMVDYASSLNIFRVRSRAELEHAWDMIVENRRNIRVPYELARKVVVEEFVTGRELTVEGFVASGRVEIVNFCEKETTGTFLVVGHFIPAAVSDAEAEALTEAARQCVEALGIRNSVFHAEIHLDGLTPHVIECAARTPGQHSVDIINRTWGVDLSRISIELAVGKPVEVRRGSPRAWHALLALYATGSGTLARIDGLDEMKARGNLVWLALDVKPGDRVRALETFKDVCGIAVIEGRTAEEARDGYRWIRDNVRFVVEKPLEA